MRSLWCGVRQLAGARNNTPVKIIEGESPPELKGNPSHYTTKTGRIIYHPSAYSKTGWSNMIYHASTLRVEVGREWLKGNLTDEEIARFVKERMFQNA